MKRNFLDERYFTKSERGVTLIELLAGISIILIIATIAIPSFAQVRKSLECRRTARSIVQLLREARSTAIYLNREYRVEFVPTERKYGLRAGDKAAETDWSAVPPVSDWIASPTEVNFSANVSSIQFNTNGTANGGTISVRDVSSGTKFNVIVARTGRIRIK